MWSAMRACCAPCSEPNHGSGAVTEASAKLRLMYTTCESNHVLACSQHSGWLPKQLAWFFNQRKMGCRSLRSSKGLFGAISSCGCSQMAQSQCFCLRIRLRCLVATETL